VSEKQKPHQKIISFLIWGAVRSGLAVLAAGGRGREGVILFHLVLLLMRLVP
jgi:hypothetical protein